MENNLKTYKNRTAEEMKEAVKLHNIKEWSPYSCSICQAPLYYLFYDNGTVTYDSACDCVVWGSNENPSSWESVANSYNRFSNKEEHAKYFGFTD